MTEQRAFCMGKIIFSKNGGKKYSHGRKLSRITKKRMRVYFCRRCKGHHLTTTNINSKDYNYN